MKRRWKNKERDGGQLMSIGHVGDLATVARALEAEKHGWRTDLDTIEVARIRAVLRHPVMRGIIEVLLERAKLAEREGDEGLCWMKERDVRDLVSERIRPNHPELADEIDSEDL